MTGTRRQRSKNEATFLETVKASLQEIKDEITLIKSTMEAMSSSHRAVQEGSIPLWDSLGSEFAGQHWREWYGLEFEHLCSEKQSSAQNGSETWPSGNGTSEHIWNILAQEFVPKGEFQSTDPRPTGKDPDHTAGTSISKDKMLQFRFHLVDNEVPATLSGLTANSQFCSIASELNASVGDFRRLPYSAWEPIYENSYRCAAAEVETRVGEASNEKGNLCREAAPSCYTSCSKCQQRKDQCICWNVFCRLCVRAGVDCICDEPIMKRRTCASCQQTEHDSFSLFDRTGSISGSPLPKFCCAHCGCEQYLGGAYYAIESAKTCAECRKLGYHQMEWCSSRSCQADSMFHVTCMENVHGKLVCTTCAKGWPKLDETQQELFKEWFKTRYHQRWEILRNTLQQCHDQVKRLQSANRTQEVQEWIAQSAEIQTKVTGIQSEEHMRQEAWVYYMEFDVDAKSISS